MYFLKSLSYNKTNLKNVRSVLGGKYMRYLSDEKIQLAAHFLFLSMGITVIKQDIEHIKQGSFKIKEPYLELLEKMVSEALHERKELRTKMKNKDVKVEMVSKNEYFSTFLFYSQGWEERRTYFNPAIKKKVEVIIQDLIKKM